ncbi:hypothetical protein GEMRC1_000966 [Eukaryota sp. GEM-RC1]
MLPLLKRSRDSGALREDMTLVRGDVPKSRSISIQQSLKGLILLHLARGFFSDCCNIDAISQMPIFFYMFGLVSSDWVFCTEIAIRVFLETHTFRYTPGEVDPGFLNVVSYYGATLHFITLSLHNRWENVHEDDRSLILANATAVTKIYMSVDDDSMLTWIQSTANEMFPRLQQVHLLILNNISHTMLIEVLSESTKIVRIDLQSKYRERINLRLNMFSTVLPVNTSLTHISFTRNSIGDDGALLLSRALEKNATLRSLNLSNNFIGDFGAINLFLCGMGTLTISKLSTLDLSRNNITNSGAVAIAQFLRQNFTLRSLDLSENRIGVHGKESLLHLNQYKVNPMTLDVAKQRPVREQFL